LVEYFESSKGQVSECLKGTPRKTSWDYAFAWTKCCDFEGETSKTADSIFHFKSILSPRRLRMH
jgi:hypothetical protein